ncbi:hypothetical protein LTR86_001042 [Recurvomyces mirabilis]|nr:hypothetical protein LTR86_001042 [Recurvomyces mirabilis]
MRYATLVAGVTILTSVYASSKPNCSLTANPHRIFILSDITNEPDDSMSMWLNSTTAPDAIVDIVNQYENVRPNLQTHTDGSFPTASHLLERVKSGPKLYGMYALEALKANGTLSDGAQLLIDVVDASSQRLYVQAWGGVNTLAEALWYVQAHRCGEEVSTFISKLSVYTISDQDDTGFWIRHTFPRIRWLASVHGFDQYGDAAWEGISVDAMMLVAQTHRSCLLHGSSSTFKLVRLAQYILELSISWKEILHHCYIHSRTA